MTQVAIDFTAPRDLGDVAGRACADKAERTTAFDTAAAGRFVLATLIKNGETPGELLTDLARKAGHVPHDDRAFGVVFKMLAKERAIRCVGYCERRKGHGTAGGRVWDAVL
jgi:hypothetical protein